MLQKQQCFGCNFVHLPTTLFTDFFGVQSNCCHQAFAQACVVYSPNLPDTDDLIRQHSVKDQASAIKNESRDHPTQVPGSLFPAATAAASAGRASARLHDWTKHPRMSAPVCSFHGRKGIAVRRM